MYAHQFVETGNEFHQQYNPGGIVPIIFDGG